MSDSKGKNTEKKEDQKVCGIIMPISPTSGYPPNQWSDVLHILTNALSKTNFTAKLVSEELATGLIMERIVTNIYNNEMIICDVSSNNPNVLFELGMRLAFDKPVVVIKDERTVFNFDTGGIEHINYPVSLRYQDINNFSAELVEKLEATYEQSKDPNFSPFLKSFGRTIKPGIIERKEITEGKFILEELEKMNMKINSLSSIDIRRGSPSKNFLGILPPDSFPTERLYKQGADINFLGDGSLRDSLLEAQYRKAKVTQEALELIGEQKSLHDILMEQLNDFHVNLKKNELSDLFIKMDKKGI